MNQESAPLRRSHFNLVEILVAMAILTIGMVGLVGIIPVSTEALSNANGKLYAAEVGQFMLDFAAADCDGLSPEVTAPAKLGALPNAFATATPADFSSNTVIGSYGGVFTLSRNAVPGIYVVSRKSDIGSSQVTDFTAYVIIWYDPVTRTLYQDVSWPAKSNTDLPVANRAAGRSQTYYRIIKS